MFIGLTEKDGSVTVSKNIDKQKIINEYKNLALEESILFKSSYREKNTDKFISIEIFEIPQRIESFFMVVSSNELFLYEIEFLNEDDRKYLLTFNSKSKIKKNYIDFNEHTGGYIGCLDDNKILTKTSVFEKEIRTQAIELENKILIKSVFSDKRTLCFANKVQVISDVPFGVNIMTPSANKSKGDLFNLAKKNETNIVVNKNFIFINEDKKDSVIAFKNIVFIEREENPIYLVVSPEEKMKFLNIQSFNVKLTLLNGVIKFTVFDNIYKQIKNNYMRKSLIGRTL
jgi:hypothetical protein